MDTNATLNSIYFHTANIALLFLCISVAFCIFYRKKLNVPFQRLFYFLVWNLSIEILAIIFSNSGYNNLPLLHIYTLGEFLLFSYFFKSLLDKPIFFKKYFWHFVITGSLFIVSNSIFFQSIFGFNTFAKTFVQVTIIGYAILYFYNLVENQLFSLSLSKSLRLINSAILVYYSGSLFIFMCSNVYYEDAQVYDMFWIFNALLNSLFQLLILVGLWKIFFKKTTL
jgi:hypothetical protein